ncbi:MAG TPA: dethiobiotin synthase [Hyphomonadaceae bacterium]|nr:dethiobiotin synthase [Hyphomonadaceae bacterium]
MSAVFVTAIGTDCGKTHVSAAILRTLTAAGRKPLGLKPLMSGFSAGRLEESDAGRLLQAMGRPITAATISEICWKSFTEWSAPNVAARHEGVALEYGKLLSFVRGKLKVHAGPALVEGAGGVMSPLTDTHTNIDLAADLALPVVLLASNYLGAVSHTLTALEALKTRRLRVAAIVVTQTLPNAGLAAPLVDELERWTRLPLLTAPYAATPAHSDGIAGELTAMLFP